MNLQIAAVAAIMGASLVAIPLAPATADDGAKATTQAQSEFSSASKKRTKVVVVDPYARYRALGIVPSFGYVGPPGYPGEYAWRKSIGQCVSDLGYGRFESCDAAASR
ncbi:MAG: hypothetical protein HXY30_02475 [Pseudorhodoplanes sp.]|nr:hypothetical protein [Pseudorhodoplanes sp.]